MSSKINKKTNYFSIVLKIILFFMFIFLLYIIILKNSMYTNMNMNSREHYEDTTNQEDSGTCKTEGDLVDFCINYKSCCGNNPKTKECLCNHPFVQNCRTNFTNCLNNNPNNLSKNDLMNSCKEANKQCCIPYNSITYNSKIFNEPIKNEPTIIKLCSITSVPNIEQKCMELCATTPNCKAYSLTTGAVVQNYGSCSLYDTISIATPPVNKATGKPIDFISNYYTKI